MKKLEPGMAYDTKKLNKVFAFVDPVLNGNGLGFLR